VTACLFADVSRQDVVLCVMVILVFMFLAVVFVSQTLAERTTEYWQRRVDCGRRMIAESEQKIEKIKRRSNPGSVVVREPEQSEIVRPEE